MYDIDVIVAGLRERGAEGPTIEVKSAAGGFPESLAETFSAFANLPGGGVAILGLDEAAGFKPVKLSDPSALAAAAANKARNAFDPAIQVTTELVRFEGRMLVLIRVNELPASAKPCVVRKTGKAYLRFADGDYELSQLERDGFVTNRGRPQFDAAEVPETTVADLETDRVNDFLATARSEDARCARIADDHTLLRKLGVVANSGALTQAGLLALGDFPQQFLPHCAIRAGFFQDGAQQSTRAIDSGSFTGPIPAIIDNAVAWVQRNSRLRTMTDDESGVVRSIADPPPIAVRELVANALIHRDLADWSSSRVVDIRMHADHVLIRNPGGLYGVTVDRLGTHPLSSTRNRLLVDICKYVRTSDRNVVEAMATGIPATFEAMARSGLPVPEFFDQALTFTVVLRRFGTDSVAPVPNRPTRPMAHESTMLDLLATPMSIDSIASALGISRNAAHKRIASLRAKGLVDILGGQGQRGSTYVRSTSPAPGP